jgi:hypothetical protein
MQGTFRAITCAIFVFAAAACAVADIDLFEPPQADALAPATLSTATPNQEVAEKSAKPADVVYDYNGSSPFAEFQTNTTGGVQPCVAQTTQTQAPIGPPTPPPEPGETSAAQSRNAFNPVNSTCQQQKGASCCDCSNCNSCRNWWVHVDYLALWVQANHLPPLVTTSPAGTPRAEAGVLPAATVLFGDNYVDGGPRNGGRVDLGYWFDDEHTNSVECSWFTVGQPAEAANFFANSLGTPILARPFFNVSTGAQDAQLAAYPGVVMGQPNTPATLGVTTTSSMDFAEFDFCHVFQRDSGWQASWIAGYRHLEFRENLQILENTISTDPANPNFAPGTSLNDVDQFKTDNDFEGGQLGTELVWSHGGWGLDGTFKLGLGNVLERVTINGMTTVTDPLGNVSQIAGLLAQPTNSGVHNRNEFAFLPELELNLHYQLTNQIDLTVGYEFLCLTRVARAGDQVNTQVSSTELPTASNTTGAPGNQPQPILRDTSLWAQGISGGIELRF